jgi:hypothetical protein
MRWLAPSTPWVAPSTIRPTPDTTYSGLPRARREIAHGKPLGPRRTSQGGAVAPLGPNPAPRLAHRNEGDRNRGTRMAKTIATIHIM